MPEITITVYGTPAPQGSKNRGRFGGLYESSPKVKPWRQAIVRAVQEHSLFIAFTSGVPVEIDVTFWLERPAGHRNAKGELRMSARRLPAVMPDLDKYVRATLDGLAKDAKVIHDDAQVVSISARKRYVDDPGILPGAVIRVRSVELAP